MNYTTMVSPILCCIFLLTTWLGSSTGQKPDCGYNATGLEGTITGHVLKGMSDYYTNNCNWNITVPPVYKIALKFMEMNLNGQQDGYCSSHYVVIESLEESGAWKFHGAFCGNISPGKTIKSEKNKLRIKHFYRGSSIVTNAYFTFTYKAVPLDPPEVVKFYIENAELKNEDVPKSVTTLFLADETYFQSGNTQAENITNQLRLQFAEDLIRNSTRPMTAGDIALYVSGLLAVCINPRGYNGVDLVHNLRKLVNDITGIPNPYLYLTLCNAGDEIKENDVAQLAAVIENQKPEMYWLDYQSMALLALVCIRDRDLGYDVKNALMKAMAEIKSYQFEDGGFGSLESTSLAVQALTAAEAKDWNRTMAIEFLNKAKLSNGSFASLYDVHALAPTIGGKTLLHLNTSRCGFSEDDVNEIRSNLSKPIRLVYSVWVGDHIDVSSTLNLNAPKGTKFFDFMRLAADENDKFKFKWINVKNYPYVYQIGGLNNDPSSGRYWTLYTGTHAMNLKHCGKGLQNYIPQDGEMAVMWYKTLTIGH